MSHSPQNPSPIKRRFADLSYGQMHYRVTGSGPALLIIHAMPGSARQYSKLIEDMASDFTVYAPDIPGAGDSDALPNPAPSAEDFGEAMLEFIDVLNIDTLKAYGSHSGGAIAAELAIRAPQRIERLVLDGLLEPSSEFKSELLEHYANPFPADLDGAYLTRIFQFCRDQFLFFPWYKRSTDANRGAGLSDPDSLKTWVQDVLNASTTYHLVYHAAFHWQASKRIKKIEPQTYLIASESDPLFDDTKAIAKKLAERTFLTLPAYSESNFLEKRKALLLSCFR
jgi:pimeloyl-ACP methyl ester carboxylesterase